MMTMKIWKIMVTMNQTIMRMMVMNLRITTNTKLTLNMKGNCGGNGMPRVKRIPADLVKILVRYVIGQNHQNWAYARRR